MRYGVVAVGLSTLACGRLDFSSGHAHSDALAPSPDVAIADAGSNDVLAGCVLDLPMDEVSWAGMGAVIDTCSGFRGTAGGNADVAQDPVRGTVGNFVGGSSCIDIPDDPKLRGGSELTLSAWVRSEQLSPASFGVISKRTDYQVNTEYNAFIWASNTGSGSANELYVDIKTNREADTNTVWADNTWHQFTAVYDGANTAVYVYTDGVRTAELGNEPTTIAPPMTEPDLAIGCLPLSGPAEGLVGQLDDVVIWNRALSAGDVATWFAQTTK